MKCNLSAWRELATRLLRSSMIIGSSFFITLFLRQLCRSINI